MNNPAPPDATSPATAQRGPFANNLVTRIIAALILAPLALALAWYGGGLWMLLALAVGIGLYAEWLHIVGVSQAGVVGSGVTALVAAALALWSGRFDLTGLAILLGLC